MSSFHMHVGVLEQLIWVWMAPQKVGWHDPETQSQAGSFSHAVSVFCDGWRQRSSRQLKLPLQTFLTLSQLHCHEVMQ